MITLSIMWCLAGRPNVCIEQPTPYQFDSLQQCGVASMPIAALSARFFPGLIPHSHCHPQEKQT